jgi:hypothetical protein
MSKPAVDPAEEIIQDYDKVATHADLELMRNKFHSDLVHLREQISLLQSRAAALEAQIAKIEPMVEARASRTEKLVLEMQIEMRKVTRFLSEHDKKEASTYSEIKGMLQTLLERSE